MVHARRCHQIKRCVVKKFFRVFMSNVELLKSLFLVLWRRHSSLPLQLVNEPETKGFLRVTVYVIGPQDAPPSPNDQDSEDEAAEQQEDIHQAVLDVLTPEKISGSGKPYHLYVSVHRVEHLPQAPKGTALEPVVFSVVETRRCLFVLLIFTKLVRFTTLNYLANVF